MFGINLGMGLGPLIGGFLATVSYAWIFIGDVATSLVCAALVLFGVAESASVDCHLQNAKFGGNLPTQSVWSRYRIVLAFCLSYFFLIAPLMGLEYAVPLLVKKEFASSLVYVGVIYSINATFILLFSFLN